MVLNKKPRCGVVRWRLWIYIYIFFERERERGIRHVRVVGIYIRFALGLSWDAMAELVRCPPLPLGGYIGLLGEESRGEKKCLFIHGDGKCLYVARQAPGSGERRGMKLWWKISAV